MNLPLPDQARHADCPRCGGRVMYLFGVALAVDAVFGLTERWSERAEIAGYVGLPVYPPHVCP
jgi:hypothetical protein